MTDEEIVAKAREIPGFTTSPELLQLVHLARRVPSLGWIVEIGPLRGRSTVALALAAKGMVVTIDNFHPGGVVQIAQLLSHTAPYDNVLLWGQDSRVAGQRWRHPIDLLFIDGDHSYEVAHSDICLFGRHAQCIAVHDYGSLVKRAVEDFMKDELVRGPQANSWQVVHIVGALATLERAKA